MNHQPGPPTEAGNFVVTCPVSVGSPEGMTFLRLRVNFHCRRAARQTRQPLAGLVDREAMECASCMKSSCPVLDVHTPSSIISESVFKER